MGTLEGLLKKVKSNVDVDTLLKEDFSVIANHLFNKCRIVKDSTEYEFVEIEFYYRSKDIDDTSVHKHNLPAGKFRVHYSGLDITFDGTSLSDDEVEKKIINLEKGKHYGGILIRSIKNLNTNKIINGPLRVQTNLLSGFDIEETHKLNLYIKEGYNNNISLAWTTRQGVNSGNYENCKLCCFNSNNNDWNGYDQKVKDRFIAEIEEKQ